MLLSRQLLWENRKDQQFLAHSDVLECLQEYLLDISGGSFLKKQVPLSSRTETRKTQS